MREPNWIRTTALLVLPLFVASLPGAIPAHAVGDQAFDPNSYDTSKLKGESLQCSDFCGELIFDITKDKANHGGDSGQNLSSKESKNAHTYSPMGGRGWSSADDLWCAQHGQTTDPTAMATSVPTPVSTAAAGSSNSCNVPILEGDGPATSDNCKTISKGVWRCMMHNSQIIPACMAYAAANDALPFEKVLLGLNILAAASCTTACVASLGSSSESGGDTGMSNSDKTVDESVNNAMDSFDTSKAGGNPGKALLSELPDSTAPTTFHPAVENAVPGHFLSPESLLQGILQDLKPAEPTLKLIRANPAPTDLRQEALAHVERQLGMKLEMFMALASAGVIKIPRAEAVGWLDGICQGATLAAAALELGNVIWQLTQSSVSVMSALSGVGAAGSAINAGLSMANDGFGNMSTTASCTAAALMAVTAGLRAWAISQDGKVKDEACKNVKKLASKATAQGTGGAPGSGGAGNGFNPFANMNGAGGYGSGSGGSSGGPLADSSSNNPTIPCGIGSCAVPPTQSSAVDGGFLNKSGMGNSLAPRLAQAFPELMNAAKNGVGPAVQGAMGGGAGPLGDAISHLAQAAQNDGENLSRAGGLGGTYSGGGGGGTGGSRSDGANPFASLFGAPGGGAARGLATENYGRPGSPSDIWHTGTTLNIFQIVSGKVVQVTNRVGPR